MPSPAWASSLGLFSQRCTPTGLRKGQGVAIGQAGTGTDLGFGDWGILVDAHIATDVKVRVVRGKKRE